MKFILATALLSFSCAMPAAAQQVALTFDDLPAHGDLPKGQSRLEIANSILATLNEQRLPPVYGFINGSSRWRSPQYIQVLRAWRAAGQPLGNHTYSHPSLNGRTAEQFERDIAEDEPLLSTLMPGQDWRWFRYPYLREGDTLEKRRAVHAYLRQHGYKIAQVTLDFDDYLWNAPYARCIATRDNASISALRKSYLATADRKITEFREATRALFGRDIPYILLLHSGAFDAQMLPDLIQLFRSRGFTFTTLPDAMDDPAYRQDPDIGLRDGGPLQLQLAAARHLNLSMRPEPEKELDATCR